MPDFNSPPPVARSRFARLRTLAALTVLLPPLLAGCSPVDALNATVGTGDLTITRDIAYGDGPRRRLDIYAPQHAVPDAPVVVFFYGGAWKEGDKADYLFAAQAFASRGMVTVVPDYRVYPEVMFPGFVEDGAAATAWVLHHIGQYGGDPHRVFLVGHSAGAYIAAMLALNAQYLARADVSTNSLAGAIGLAGPYDFLPLTRLDMKPIFEILPDTSVTQPITFARKDAPPMLLLVGEADRNVDPANTTRLASRLRSVGARVEMKPYKGIAHIGIITALTALFRERAPVLDDIATFIRTAPVR